jgi:hypothetical protein
MLLLGTMPTASEALALSLACFAAAKRSVHPLTTACAASATSASPWLVNRFTALPRPLSEIWRCFPLHGVSRNRRSKTQSCAALEAASSPCFMASNSMAAGDLLGGDRPFAVNGLTCFEGAAVRIMGLFTGTGFYASRGACDRDQLPN